MKKFDDISWGKLPENDPRKDMTEEFELIHEWREWNSDLKVAESLIESNRSPDTLSFGENVYKVCKKEMQKICRELRKIRKENGRD